MPVLRIRPWRSIFNDEKNQSWFQRSMDWRINNVFAWWLALVFLFGSTDLGLNRASSICICQSTPRCVLLTSADHAVISRRRVSHSPSLRPPTDFRVMLASSFSTIFSQLPCLGGSKSRFDEQRSVLVRVQTPVEGTDRARVEIVTHVHDLLTVFQQSRSSVEMHTNADRKVFQTRTTDR